MYTETMTARLQLPKILCKSSLDALEKAVAAVIIFGIDILVPQNVYCNNKQRKGTYETIIH